MNTRRLVILSLLIAGLIAVGFFTVRGGKPIGWFACVSRASTGFLSVDARGEGGVAVVLRPGAPNDVPIEKHWKVAWGADGGTLDGVPTHSAEAARSMATQLVDAAAQPGPYGQIGASILRVNVTLEASCDGEEGRGSFFTAGPTLADCRSAYDVSPAHGKQCYRTWLSATLHRGSETGSALFFNVMVGLDGGV